MNTTLKHVTVSLAAMAVAFGVIAPTANASITDGTIDATDKYAWGNRTGWVNFGNAGGNVHVTDDGVTGYAWSANHGWINLNPTASGVENDGTGDLSGYAWGEGLGWIDFSGVTIDDSGVFAGLATVTSDNSKISFDCTDCTVKTDWRPSAARPVCNNGLDDDGDTKIDFPDDPGCMSANDGSEDDIVGEIVVDVPGMPSLLADGYFVPDPGSPSTSTPSLSVEAAIKIEISGPSATSTVQIPDGTIITRADGGVFDATAITGETPSASSLENLDIGKVVAGKLRWGVPNIGLQFSNPITIKIWVGASYDGRTLIIQRSVAGNRWTTDGIVAPGTCVVASGFCTFQTTKASYFISSYTVATDSGGAGFSAGILGITTPVPNPVTSQPPVATATTVSTTTSASLSDISFEVTASGVVVRPENLVSIKSLFPSMVSDAVLEAKYLPLIKVDAKEFGVKLDATQEKAILDFVVYGISQATVKLGAGERRALIRDYLQTVGRADVKWDDIERITVGQKIKWRNLAMERANVSKVLAYFRVIYNKEPDFKNASEDLVWNTLFYRTRFPRDLAKERTGITKFKLLFFRTPSTPIEWAAVRGLGYAKK